MSSKGKALVTCIDAPKGPKVSLCDEPSPVERKIVRKPLNLTSERYNLQGNALSVKKLFAGFFPHMKVAGPFWATPRNEYPLDR